MAGVVALDTEGDTLSVYCDRIRVEWMLVVPILLEVGSKSVS